MAIQFQVIDFSSGYYQKACQLRDVVLRRPLGMELSLQDTQNDHLGCHLAGFDADLLMCTAILYQSNDAAVKITQVAIDSAYQARGIGRQLMAFAEASAKNLSAVRCYCHARLTVKAFYQAIGYQPQGEIFEEIGIPHIVMQKCLLE
jgi:predicted GNAT family N-acyltransferase